MSSGLGFLLPIAIKVWRTTIFTYYNLILYEFKLGWFISF